MKAAADPRPLAEIVQRQTLSALVLAAATFVALATMFMLTGLRMFRCRLMQL